MGLAETLRAALCGEDPWEIAAPSPAPGPSPELRARRAQGRRAYARAMERRGVPRLEARIMASAAFLWADDD